MIPPYAEINLLRGYFCARLPLLKKGALGGAVWAMQTLLSDRGYSTGGVDSAFGINTEAAVKRFQRDFDLEADGECGCLTWEKLINGG